MQSKDSGYR